MAKNKEAPLDLPKRGRGRPPGSKDKKKRKVKPKLVVTPKRFRPPRPLGAPRKDGMPPIQRRKIAANDLPEVEKLTKVLARIRHLAGRGLLEPHIAVLTGIPVAELAVGGMYYEDMQMGIAEALLAVAENHYDRVLKGKSTHEVMFYLESIGKWSRTADGRKKARGETGEVDEVSGVDVSFEDDDEDSE